MKISIIIPAHNEENTIERCLHNILEGPNKKNLQVIVVCNGCNDDTVKRAKVYVPYIQVIEIDTGSKSLALNIGDTFASNFPRFYIDADIIVTQQVIWEVAKRLENNEALAAAPRMKIDLKYTGSFVKAFYHVWVSLPYARKGMIGSGIYGLSAAGRERFSSFPEITSDDGFVRLHFQESERITVENVFFTVVPPENIYWLIAIKTRALLGKIELAQEFPLLEDANEKENQKTLLSRLRKGQQVSEILVYLFLKCIIWLNARRSLVFGDLRYWVRDPSSRKVRKQ